MRACATGGQTTRHQRLELPTIVWSVVPSGLDSRHNGSTSKAVFFLLSAAPARPAGYTEGGPPRRCLGERNSAFVQAAGRGTGVSSRMQLGSAGSTVAFPRMQERHRLRSRPGGRPHLVRSGRVRLGLGHARLHARKQQRPTARGAQPLVLLSAVLIVAVSMRGRIRSSAAARTSAPTGR